MRDEGTGITYRFEPGDTTPPKRTLLLLHGTGGNENDLVPLGPILLPGAALLSPRGQVTESGMPRFFRRIQEGVFDLADLRQRTIELGTFVDRAREAHGLDGTRMSALGFSNGANIASALAMARPGLLQDLVLLRPMLPYDPAPLPHLGGLRVLIAQGIQDPTVPRGQTERLSGLFREAGATVTVHQTQAGHGLVPADYQAVSEWFRQA